ncbi:MAG: hypothetical protein WCE30_10855 [Mycobacterium sp.]
MGRDDDEFDPPNLQFGLERLEAAGIDVGDDAKDAIRDMYVEGLRRSQSPGRDFEFREFRTSGAPKKFEVQFFEFMSEVAKTAKSLGITTLDARSFGKIKTALCPWHPFC